MTGLYFRSKTYAITLFNSVIDPFYLPCIYQFGNISDDKNHDGPNVNVKDLSWLVNLMIESGKRNPQIIVPQIVPFFVNTIYQDTGFGYSYNETDALKFFGEQLKEIKQLLITEIDISQHNDRNKGLIEFAQTEAKKHIS
jgi:hypothetical protein